jgi:hypothetical protein
MWSINIKNSISGFKLLKDKDKIVAHESVQTSKIYEIKDLFQFNVKLFNRNVNSW